MDLDIMKILVVEDNLDFAEALFECLTFEGYVVDVVTNGELAWERAIGTDYNLILSDIEIPQLDGISLCKKLRWYGYRLPIFLMTGLAPDLPTISTNEAKANAYFFKPFNFQELLEQIRFNCTCS
ncbi:response regulator transcription factor [Coleofasciculus sp. G3-WIS-01]|uniref:response regulator transcription factor n=1 Tax=Coleofasciculus sp. G3-WIS-01 TaxID=3069528 RepID=UPI0040643860